MPSASRHRFQLGDVAEVDDVVQLAHLLGDPQADVGRAGQQQRLRMGGAQRASSSSVRGAWKAGRMANRCAGVALQRAQRIGHRARSNSARGSSVMRRAASMIGR
jgi:hypothetical protein